MISRAEAAARAYPYYHDDKTPTERMDMMRRSLRAADEVMFSEEAMAKAIEAAYFATRPKGTPFGSVTVSKKDCETIVRAVVESLKRDY